MHRNEAIIKSTYDNEHIVCHKCFCSTLGFFDGGELTASRHESKPYGFMIRNLSISRIELLFSMPKAIHERSSIHGASRFMPVRAIHYGHALTTLEKPSLSCVPIFSFLLVFKALSLRRGKRLPRPEAVRPRGAWSQLSERAFCLCRFCLCRGCRVCLCCYFCARPRRVCRWGR